MGNDIFYNHLTGFADLKLDATITPHRLLGRLAGGDYFVIGADGKDGANQYLYIAYADDEFGTNFSTTKPSSYISFYQSTTPVSNLTASMFTEWKRYVGKDGTSGKSVYVGYAQSQAGNGFSFVAGRERPFVAFITSDKPQEEITAADFAGANFVRFHDSGWNNISLDDLTDVDTANEAGETVLMYDASASAWRAVRLSDVCYTGNYADLIDAPTPYTFDSTMFQEDPDTHEISIASDYVQASLAINSDPQRSTYFLNQNGDWVEITEGGGSGGDPGSSTTYQFIYPLSESNGRVDLLMDNSDTNAASVGWVLSQGYISSISSDLIDPILLINREFGSSSRVLAENGTWVDLPQNSGGGESPTYTFQSPLQENGGNVTLDTSGFLLTGALDEYALKADIPIVPTKVSAFENDRQYITVSALSGYALKTDIPTVPTKVSELENDEGYLTEVTKESVDTALGISANGSADKYLNEQGQFVELETGGVSDISFDSDFFIVGDDGTVTLQLAGNGTKGIAGFGIPEFNVDETGFVSLKTRQVTSTNGLFTVDYVKEWETYSDGSWYRLWASGWLEQGGKIIITTQTNTTVTFPMEFADTEYNLQYTMSRQNMTSTDTAQIRFCAVSELTTTSFATRTVVSADQGHSWYACGWSA